MDNFLFDCTAEHIVPLSISVLSVNTTCSYCSEYMHRMYFIHSLLVSVCFQILT